jgi:hypothetical protein
MLRNPGYAALLPLAATLAVLSACEGDRTSSTDGGTDVGRDTGLPAAACAARECQAGDFVYEDTRCIPQVYGSCVEVPVGNGCCYQPCATDADCTDAVRPFCSDLPLYAGTDDPRFERVRVCQQGRGFSCADATGDEPCCNLSPAECQADPACQVVESQDATGTLDGGRCFYREPPATATRTYLTCATKDPDRGQHEF